MSLSCSHRPPCPGCPELGRTGWPRRARLAVEQLCAMHGLEVPPLVQGGPTGFRRRARLAIRGRATSPKIGLFEEGSHRVVHIPRCAVHHPAVNDVARALRTAIQETRTAPYSEDAGLGLARYVQIVVGRGGDRVQVVLVGNTEDPRALAPLGEALAALLGDRLHSLFLNGNPGRTNVILGPHWARLSGPEALEEPAGGVTVHYPPGAFGQSHAELSERVAAWVRARVPPAARVVELYAGVGAIGLSLAAASESLMLNEAAPAGVRGLELGVDRLDPTVRARVTLRPGPAEHAVDLLASADAVIVDPPRKGLGPAVMDALVARPPARLLYVACGLAAFLAETARLTTDGRMRLVELGAFDLFAHTEHVELVGRLERAGVG